VINSTGLEGEYEFDLASTMPLPLGAPEGNLINGAPTASWPSNWNVKEAR
jgi:hypothetical protein